MDRKTHSRLSSSGEGSPLTPAIDPSLLSVFFVIAALVIAVLIAADSPKSAEAQKASPGGIQGFAPSGTWSGKFGFRWVGGSTLDGSMYAPAGLAVDTSGDVLLADSLMHRVQQFVQTGDPQAFTPVKKWGVSSPNQDGGNDSFAQPSGIAVSSDGGFYVVDNAAGGRVVQYSAARTFVRRWYDSTGDSLLNAPGGLAVGPTGDLYVADTGNHRVVRYSGSGGYLSRWGSFGISVGKLFSPNDIAVDDPTGDVYVADTGNNRVQKFTAQGDYITSWGSLGTDEGEFNGPKGIAVNVTGDVFVADTGNDRIQTFDLSGGFVHQWGIAGSGDEGFTDPSAVAVAPDGRVFVADTGNDRVQYFTPDLAPRSTLTVSPATPNGNNGWYSTTPTLTLSCDESPACTPWYQWDSEFGAWNMYSTPRTPSQGEHEFFYRSVDMDSPVAHTEDPRSKVIQLDTVKPTNPSFESSHAVNDWSNMSLVEMEWPGASDGSPSASSGIDGYSFSYTSGATDIPDYSKDTSENDTRDAKALGAGSWYFHLRTKDNAGHWSDTKHYGPMKIDPTDPDLRFRSTAKPAGAYVRDTITIPTYAADSSSGLSQVSLLGGLFIQKSGSAPYFTFAWNTKIMKNGRHTLYLKAYDTVGNQKIVPRTYKVDNYLPRTFAPRRASVKRFRNVRLYYQANDPYSNKVYLKLLIRDSKGRLVKTMNMGWEKPGIRHSYLYKNVSLRRGKYRFVVYAKDRAGNKQKSRATNTLIVR